MDINLNLTVDFSERAGMIVDRIAAALGLAGNTASTRPQEAAGRPEKAVQVIIPEKRESASEAKTEPKPEPKPETKPEPKPETKPEEKSKYEHLLEPFTDADLLAEMNKCRKRLLGDEPKKNPHYAALTGFIRNLAADSYGADVPRNIPQEKRGYFINDLRHIEEEEGVFSLPDDLPKF